MDRLSSLSRSALRLRFGLSLELELQPHALFTEQTSFIQAIENQVGTMNQAFLVRLLSYATSFTLLSPQVGMSMIVNFIRQITRRDVVNTVQRENSHAQLRHDTGSLLTPNLGRSNFPKFGKQWTVNILNYLWNPTVLFKPQEA